MGSDILTVLFGKSRGMGHTYDCLGVTETFKCSPKLYDLGSTEITPSLVGVSRGANTSSIRVVTIDGNPWFVAKDVCEVLGLTHTGKAMQMLDEDEKGVYPIHTLGGNQKLTVISESGLYKRLMRSDKEVAKPFQDWVTKVVLPAIRKDGAYIMGEEKVASGEMSEAWKTSRLSKMSRPVH